MANWAALTRRVVLLGLVVLLVSVTDGAYAQAEGGDTAPGSAAAAVAKHLLTNMPPKHDDVSVVHTFVDMPGMTSPAGKELEVLIGFYNEGEEELTITGVAGSLNTPQDFNYNVQNFTAKPLEQTVEPGGQVSLIYRFTPHAQLQPFTFQVALTVFYNASDELIFSTTFFNSTLEITDPASIVDGQTFFLYFLILAMLGLAGLGIHRLLEQYGVVKKRKANSGSRGSSARGGVAASRQDAGAKSGAEAAADTDEWLRGTNAPGFARKKAAAKH